MEREANRNDAVTTVRLRHDDGLSIVVGDALGNWSLFKDDGAFSVNSEYTISGIDVPSLKTIASAVGWEALMDMFEAASENNDDARATSILEIMYVCHEVRTLATIKMNDKTRKSAYANLMKKALALKDKTVKISGATKA